MEEAGTAPGILVPLRKPAGDHATFQPCPLAGIQSSHAPLSPYQVCPLTLRWPSVWTGLSLHVHVPLLFRRPGSTFYLDRPLPWQLVTSLRCSWQGISLTVAPAPLPLLLPNNLLVSGTKSQYVTQVQGDLGFSIRQSQPPVCRHYKGKPHTFLLTCFKHLFCVSPSIHICEHACRGQRTTHRS